MSRTVRVASLVLIVALTAAAVVVWKMSEKTDDNADAGWPLAQVRLARVERTQMPQVLHAVGELEAVHQVQVAAEVAGRIASLSFTPGQRVSAGQRLVQLNDAPEQADRLRLTAQLHNAERALARTQVLQASKAMTLEQLDNAIAARDMTRGELQRIDALIAQKAIRAPFAGVMGIARVHLGQYLSAGESIANLVDASTLHVNFALAEQALAQVAIAHPVEIAVDAWPQQVFAGSISAIDPLVTAARTVQLQAQIPNPQGQLQAGMFANVRVLMAEQPMRLTVPETAVTYSAWGQTVFVAEADDAGVLRVRRVLVTSGQRWPGRVEIESGLSADQQVVVSGQIKLSDGMQVLAAPAADTP